MDVYRSSGDRRIRFVELQPSAQIDGIATKLGILCGDEVRPEVKQRIIYMSSRISTLGWFETKGLCRSEKDTSF